MNSKDTRECYDILLLVSKNISWLSTNFLSISSFVRSSETRVLSKNSLYCTIFCFFFVYASPKKLEQASLRNLCQAPCDQSFTSSYFAPKSTTEEIHHGYKQRLAIHD
ncbi:hypothetical protein AAHE18_12G043900 [Arachis hypogaea]